MLALARRVIPQRLKVDAARMLCRPTVGRVVAYATSDSIPCQGVRIATDTRSISDRTKAAIFWGLYESAELRYLKRYLRPDLDVVELGASIGVMAAHAARLLHPGVRYLAVEANPALCDILARNLGGVPNGTVIHSAVDASPQAGDTLPLRLGPTNVAARVDLVDPAGTGRCRVPRVTLGDLLRQRGIERYQLLCDIEGSEASLLRHDRAAFHSCQSMIIELHAAHVGGATYTVDDLRDLIVSLGFHVVARHGPVFVFSR